MAVAVAVVVGGRLVNCMLHICTAAATAASFKLNNPKHDILTQLMLQKSHVYHSLTQAFLIIFSPPFFSFTAAVSFPYP